MRRVCSCDGGIRRTFQKLGKVFVTRCVHSAGAVFIAALIYLQATGDVVARHVITNDNLTRRMHQLEVLHSAPTVRQGKMAIFKLGGQLPNPPHADNPSLQRFLSSP